ncbi:MAG: disulfide bond formation protein B [Alphaproteobacteria bacterium]|nr:disulfide bond formation protein B [Alphaproteobacteria bacterium]
MKSLIFAPSTVFLISLIVAISALGAAFVAQFSFGLKPCILCLYARVPYVFLIIVSVLALLNGEKHNRLFLILLTIGFLASLAIAGFHVGVEQHWWELSGGCPVEKLAAKTSEEMLADLLATPLAPCDKVAWKVFDISIVIWNAALSLVMCAYLLLALLKKKADA